MSFGEDIDVKKRGKAAQPREAKRTLADVVIGETFDFAEPPMVAILPEPRAGETDRDYIRRMSRETIHRRAPTTRAILAYTVGSAPAVRFINAEGKPSRRAYVLAWHLRVASLPAPPIEPVKMLAEILTLEG